MKTTKKIHFFTEDGLRLCGIQQEAYDPKGTVLLAHGINTDKDEWNGFYKKISDKLNQNGYSSLRFDFRGHGESEGKQEDLTIKGMINDITAARRQIEPEKKVIIIASSFGAPPSILYINSHQADVEKLVLLNPVLDFNETFLKPHLEWALSSFNDDGFKHLSRYGYLLLDGSFKIGRSLINEMGTTKPYEILMQLKTEVLTIHGTKDTMVPFDVSKKYGKPNQKSDFIPIEGADHGFVEADDEKGNSKESIRNQDRVIKLIIQWIGGSWNDKNQA